MTGKLLSSTFAPRPYPEAIMLRDEHTVFGPFCIHCGAPEVEHSATKRCPANVPVLYPPPCCPCHGPENCEDRPVHGVNRTTRQLEFLSTVDDAAGPDWDVRGGLHPNRMQVLGRRPGRWRTDAFEVNIGFHLLYTRSEREWEDVLAMYRRDIERRLPSRD